MMRATQAILSEVKLGLNKLIDRNGRLVEDQKKLEVYIANLQKQLSEAHDKIMSLEDQNRQLRTAKAVSGGDESSDEAKAKINELVREIDKCLALLNV